MSQFVYTDFFLRNSKVTGNLFDDLKEHQDEPSEAGFDTGSASEPVEFLLRLPGITQANYKSVVDEVENIFELSQMSQAKLQKLIGPRNGSKLYSFFNSPYDAS